MIKVLMTKVGLQMGYIFDKNYIARKMNRGRREHGMCCIPEYLPFQSLKCVALPL